MPEGETVTPGVRRRNAHGGTGRGRRWSGGVRKPRLVPQMGPLPGPPGDGQSTGASSWPPAASAAPMIPEVLRKRAVTIGARDFSHFA